MNMNRRNTENLTADDTLAHRITAALELNLSKIDAPKLAKLRAARADALAAYREPVRVLGLVTVSGQLFDTQNWFRKPVFLVPLVTVVLLVVVGTYNTITKDDLADDTGALDAKVLASETPIDALLDNDFATWVQESSQQ